MKGLPRSAQLPLALVLVVAGAATAILAVGSSSKTKLPGNAKKLAPADGFRGSTLSPVRHAPPIRLRGNDGAFGGR